MGYKRRDARHCAARADEFPEDLRTILLQAGEYRLTTHQPHSLEQVEGHLPWKISPRNPMSYERGSGAGGQLVQSLIPMRQFGAARRRPTPSARLNLGQEVKK